MKRNKTHLQEDRVYHIQSSSVSRNPLFYNKALCDRFLKKIEHYLSPICDVLHYAIDNSEFQLIIKLHSKARIEAHWALNKARNHDSTITIPLVSHIFSKAMSDLLVSTVQHFNYHHQRKGGLMAHRFRRHLIKTRVELDQWINRMDRMEPYQKRFGVWAKVPTGYRLRKNRRERMRMKHRCAGYFYRKMKAEPLTIKSFKRIWELELRGCFKNFPKHLIEEKINTIPSSSTLKNPNPPP